MSDTIKKFNSIVKDLLEQTIDLIGTKYLFNFKLMTKINALAPIEKFTSNMLPYKQYILERDVIFFLNKKYELNSNINQNEIIDLQKIFLNIDAESQENIWDTLHVLIILAEERLNSKKHTNICVSRN